MPCLAMLHDALQADDPALQLKHTCEAWQVPCLLNAIPEQLNLSPLFQLNPNTLTERCGAAGLVVRVAAILYSSAPSEGHGLAPHAGGSPVSSAALPTLTHHGCPTASSLLCPGAPLCPSKLTTGGRHNNSLSLDSSEASR